MEPRTITIKGAREHNLKEVALTLPRNRLICFTGISGSGKSSLAFDTLFAEGQRRYMESLSSYARQFLTQLSKPDVDQITGLSPSISIQQKTAGWNPRSTVGTITQVYDYLRVLFARVGKQHCPECGQLIRAQTREQIIARISELPEGTKFSLLAPVVRGQKGEHLDLFDDLRRDGYARARVDGRLISLNEPPKLVRNQRHDIEVVVDRLTRSATGRARLAEAVEQALRLGKGTLIVQQSGEPAGEAPSGPTPSVEGRSERAARRPKAGAEMRDLLLSSDYACPDCGLSFEPPSPQLLSFNSPVGMCIACEGLGDNLDFDPDLLVPDPSKSLLELAVAPLHRHIGRWRKHIYQGVADYVGFDLRAPWGKLPARAKRALLDGLGETKVPFKWRNRWGTWCHDEEFPGIVAELKARYGRTQSAEVRAYYEKFMRRGRCPDCEGTRLNPQARAVRLGGRSLPEVCGLCISDARAFFEELSLTETEQQIARLVLKEVRGRLKFLEDVGLHYLTLDRAAPTLAGGEAQRIRLASQIGAGLVGVLYILDEPSIGLHPRDNQRLLDSLCRLRDQGNTVIVVEHDEQTMRVADQIVDFGPGPGLYGGEVVAQGTLEQVARARRSITGRYLRGAERIEVPAQRRPVPPPPATVAAHRTARTRQTTRRKSKHGNAD
ncbi:MAG TPA: excinuclease ABC subunit UvrA [Phycisphaerae bacterium]|nr:excinuclease ABC subunit UvrA [Phycisphaerae bacterium]HNU44145.1 excinuclease ABC subunit UvrA [Phycisphaerae bacterium]